MNLENLSEAINIIVHAAEEEIDKGNCYDRKVTRIHPNSKATHLSTGKILPADKWKRVRIVVIPVDDNSMLLYVKRLRIGVEDER